MEINGVRRILDIDEPSKGKRLWLGILTWIEIHWKILINKFSDK